VFVQVCEVVLPNYNVPPIVMQVIINTLVVMFPVVLLLGRYTRLSRLFLDESDAPLTGESDEPGKVTGEAEEILQLQSAAIDFPVAMSEKRQITTVACLVRGVRSGKDDPELLLGVVPDIEDELQSIVDRYEGIRLASGRNEIVVAFGYPVVHEDDVRRAAKAAQEIVALVRAQDRDNDPETSIIGQAGLHTDVVIIGEAAGSGDPLTLLGSNTMIAEWLLALAPENGIALSADSHEALKSYFHLDQIGNQSHPRLGNDAPVYTLGRELAGQLQHVVAGGPEYLLGRDNEHRMLLDHWQTVLDGESQYVMLIGEPGIGKSSLLQQTVRDLLSSDSPELIVLNCESYYQGSPMRPVISYLERRVFESDHTLSHVDRLQKLTEFLDTQSIDTPESLPFLARLLAIESRDPALAIDASEKLVREKTLNLLLTLIHEIAKRQPLLLVVEDLHWADPSTIDLIERLLTESPDFQICGLLTARPEFDADWGNHSHVYSINLSRLPSRVSEDLARQRLKSITATDALVEQIARESGGIPLYIDELARGLRQSNTSPGQVDAGSLVIPQSLQAALAARVEKLGSSKPLLQLCAVLGHEFDYKLLREVVQTDDEALLRNILANLVGEGMLFQRGAHPDVTYRFKHQLLMEAAYQSLITKTRKQLHLAIGRTIENAFPELCKTFPLRLAQHFGRAGDAGKAIEYRIKAAQKAHHQFAINEALVQIERGFDLLEQVADPRGRESAELALQNLKGSLILATKGFTNEEAMVAFERAVELSERAAGSPELFRVVGGLWMYYLIKADFKRAGELSTRLSEIADGIGEPPELLQADYAVGYGHFYVGELDKAYEYFRRSIEHEEPGQNYSRQSPSNDDTRVHVHCVLSQALWFMGRSDEAKKEQDGAVELAMESGQPYAQVWALYQVAFVSHMQGDYAAIKAATDQLMNIAVDKGIHFFVPLGLFFANTQIEDPRERINGMMSEHQKTMLTGARAGSTYLKCMIAEEMLRQEMLDDARDQLREIRSIVESTGERLWECELMRLETLLRLRRDELTREQVDDALRDAMRVGLEVGVKPFALRSALALYEHSGGSEEAFAALSDIIDSYPVNDTTTEFTQAKEIIAAQA
jgi:class 3 adenylate cyclase/tetratricopeptide (TPR) repeat protein